MYTLFYTTSKSSYSFLNSSLILFALHFLLPAILRFPSQVQTISPSVESSCLPSIAGAKYVYFPEMNLSYFDADDFCGEHFAEASLARIGNVDEYTLISALFISARNVSIVPMAWVGIRRNPDFTMDSLFENMAKGFFFQDGENKNETELEFIHRGGLLPWANANPVKSLSKLYAAITYIDEEDTGRLMNYENDVALPFICRIPASECDERIPFKLSAEQLSMVCAVSVAVGIVLLLYAIFFGSMKMRARWERQKQTAQGMQFVDAYYGNNPKKKMIIHDPIGVANAFGEARSADDDVFKSVADGMLSPLSEVGPSTHNSASTYSNTIGSSKKWNALAVAAMNDNEIPSL